MTTVRASVELDTDPSTSFEMVVEELLAGLARMQIELEPRLAGVITEGEAAIEQVIAWEPGPRGRRPACPRRMGAAGCCDPAARRSWPRMARGSNAVSAVRAWCTHPRHPRRVSGRLSRRLSHWDAAVVRDLTSAPVQPVSQSMARKDAGWRCPTSASGY